MVGFFDLKVDTTAKRAGIRDAFAVEHYKWGRTVSMNFWFPHFLVYWLTGSMISDLLCYADSVTPVSAETVGNHIGQTPLHFPQVQLSFESGVCQNSRQSHRPNTTTLSTSSAFIGILSYTSIQPSLGAQFHTSCIFYKFPV